MKTAISIPDEVFAEAEQLAKRLQKSRSQLYAEALAEYLHRHDADAVTEAFNRTAAAVDTRPDRLMKAAAARLLAEIEW
jgi:predicted transcriptional regulator